jgi:L-histidine N-alpha-methyltransferase
MMISQETLARFQAAEAAPATIDVLLGPDEWNEGLRRDALAGLSADPKTLPPTWLYDEAGSALYDEITRVPEYYPARTEQSILDDWADEMIATADADTLVELGSGTSDKTRALLDEMAATGRLRRYVPFDVAESTLRDSARRIAQLYNVEVHGVVGDFRRHIDSIPEGGTRLFAFLGGTIGNLDPAERRTLLSQISEAMYPGDTLLVGTDLIKDRGRLVRAYDDAAGVTAAFNKNVLAVLNHELAATFDLDEFDHVALFDEQEQRIEMRLRARSSHSVDLPGLGLSIDFAEGEELRTEISSKFRPDLVRDELADAGLVVNRMWTDPDGDFALTMAVR